LLPTHELLRLLDGEAESLKLTAAAHEPLHLRTLAG
jgi:hypothetical protein